MEKYQRGLESLRKIVQVEDLEKEFKLVSGETVKALDGVSFSINKGEVLGVIGESGSGKTTLLRIVRGVETFNRGVVRVGDVTLTPKSTPKDFYQVKLRTAIHLQRSFGLWPESVVSNVMRALYYTKAKEEFLPPEGSSEYNTYFKKAVKLLNIVGLGHRTNLWAEVLSGGEKQRLILARQLAKNPAVLLLDEPATMTCPKTRADVLEAIKSANRKMGTTVLVVSHMVEVHKKISQRLIWLDKGSIRAEGDTNLVLKKFLAKRNRAKPKIALPKKSPTVMSLERVKKTYRLVPYGEVFTLEDVSLDVRKGEILAFVGPSGAGKTVLLRLLAGLEVPTRGKIYYRSGKVRVNISQLGWRSIEARRKIGILHQEYSLPYWSQVIDLLAARLGLKSWKTLEALAHARKIKLSGKAVDTIQRIAELPEEEAKMKLKGIGLTIDIIKELFPAYSANIVKQKAAPIFSSLRLSPSLLHRRAYELSAGEQLRVAIVASLLSNPEVLILDEPFGDLDPITLRKITNLLKDINRKLGITILLVDHQLDAVRETAHRAALIEGGKLIACDTPEKIIRIFLGRGRS